MRHLAALLFLLAAWTSAQAFVPDARENCQIQNAARCKVGDNEFMVDGPCPPEAITLRPPGQAPCGDAFPRERPNDRPERPGRPAGEAKPAADPSAAPTPPLTSPPPPDDGLLTGGLMAALATLLAASFFLLQRLLRRLRAHPMRLSLADLATLVAGGIGGFWVAWQGAAFAFTQVAAHFQNNDSAGPALIGALAALIVFTLLLPLASSLITFLLFKLLDRMRR